MRNYLLVLCFVLLLAVPLYAQDHDTSYEIALERIQWARERSALVLNLSGLGLTELPPEIGQLSDLQALYLHANRLSVLPREIGQLTNLKVLFLYSNDLTVLPSEIGQLTNLRYFTVAGNQLTELPLALGNLTNLTCLQCHLNLSGNPLESPPPDVVRQGTHSVLAYLRNRIWDDMRRLIAGTASGVGLLVALILGVQSRQTRRKPKAKRGLA